MPCEAPVMMATFCGGVFMVNFSFSAGRVPLPDRRGESAAERPPRHHLYSLRVSVTNRAATAASTAEARTINPAVRNTVCKVVDETRIAPRPDPAARAI